MKYYPEGILYDTAANRAALHSRAALAEAMEKGQILEAKAGLCTESHDLIVRLPGGEGMIPREEAAAGIKEGTVRDIAILSRVGRPVAFVIDRLEGEEGRGADLTVRLGNVPCSGSGGRLDLFGPRPGLLGLELDAEGLPPFEGEKLPFLTLLWEEGRIPPGNIRVI